MKLIKYTALATLLVSAFAANAANAAETGTLTITGNILEKTCTVSPGQLTQTIAMDAITPVTLQGLGDNAAVPNSDKPLQFDVTGCPGSTSAVGIKFDFNTPAGTNNEYMGNSETTGAATGVAFGIVDEDGAQIKSGDEAKAKNVEADGSAVVKATVRAYRQGTAAPVAGNIVSTAVVTLTTN